MLAVTSSKRLALGRAQVGREPRVSTFRRPPKQRAQLDSF